MARGYVSEAVEILAEVKQYCSYATPRGGRALLEYGLALESSGDKEASPLSS